jgi:hypothetical protein
MIVLKKGAKANVYQERVIILNFILKVHSNEVWSIFGGE